MEELRKVWKRLCRAAASTDWPGRFTCSHRGKRDGCVQSELGAVPEGNVDCNGFDVPSFRSIDFRVSETHAARNSRTSFLADLDSRMLKRGARDTRNAEEKQADL